ncbi:quinone oxidoreductase family protein [Aquimarina algiphila]|uniref:quinone oxidoreductase family protein n=1 Tax=Aquimarina algiphila TaxID=2047982 RepID=UPI00249221DA|nr:zinc-binding alcohol dehydrogenase family protein [Aquimarina algiphila]
MKSVAFFCDNLVKTKHTENQDVFVFDEKRINIGLIEEEDLSLSEFENPDDYVLVKKNAFSCNFRDRAVLLGRYFQIKEDEEKRRLSYNYIGSEFVGEVIEVGKNVKDFKIGDKVIPNISYPSYSKDYTPGLPTDYSSMRIEGFKSNNLFKVPKDIPDEVLASFPIAAFTSYSMIRKVITPHSKVLVTSAKSNTSLAIIRALRNYSVQVYAMTSNNLFSDQLKSMGVEDVIVVNHGFNNYLEDKIVKNQLKEIGGFDVVFDPFFDTHLPRVIDLINMDGKYITCGLANQLRQPDYEIKGLSFSDVIIKAMINNISIIGNCIGVEEDGLKALEDYQNGKFEVIIDKVYSLGQEKLFFERAFNFDKKIGKVVYKYKN